METSQQEKKLTHKQIRFLQIALLILGGSFLVFYFLFIYKGENNSNQTDNQTNNSVYYQNQRLTIGREVLHFKNSADRFTIHGDYLLVSKPFNQTTQIYSLKQQEKVKDIKKDLLDFDGKNVLYNEKGINTHFNGKDLHTTCFGGYIKSPTEILCIVPKKDDNLDNKLVTINPQDLTIIELYSSKITLHYVTYVKGTVYIGGFSLQTKENYLIMNGKPTEVPNRVNVLYEKQNNIYFGSFQNEANSHVVNYYKIKQTTNGVTTNMVENGKIVF